MSTFTKRLKDVVEMEARNGLDKYQACGLDTFPIFMEEYRHQLADKLIDHFWNQEIGQETVSMWRFAMRRKMNEIMPQYNQHYELSLLEASALVTVDLRTIVAMDSEATSTAVSESKSDSGSKTRAVLSETPQTALQANADYASSMQDNVGETKVTGEGTDNSTQNQTGTTDNHMIGYQGHAPQLIMAARQAVVNVDMMVINDLQQDMFMLIWNTSDSYYPRRKAIYYGL